MNIFTLLYSLLAFVLAAGVFYKVYLGSVLPSFLIAITIIFLRIRYRQKIILTPELKFVFVAVTCWFVISLLSAGLNTQHDIQVLLSFVSAYLVGYAIFLCSYGYPLSRRQSLIIADSVLLGSFVPLILGMYAAISYLGFPFGMLDIVSFRFSRVASETYRVMVLGNLTSVAAYLVVVFAVFFVRVSLGEIGWKKWLGMYLPWLLLASLNSLLILSRTQIVVTIFMLLMTLLFFKRRKSIATLAVFFVGIVATILFNDDFLFILDNLVNAVTFDSKDNSVSERIESIHFGYEIIKDHYMIGVGPGRTYELNPLTAAHQFNVQLASEIGLIGAIIVSVLMFAILVKYVALFFTRNRIHRVGSELLVITPVMTYFIYALLANAPKATNTVNGWIGLVFLFIPFVFNRIREFDNDEASTSKYQKW